MIEIEYKFILNEDKASKIEDELINNNFHKNSNKIYEKTIMYDNHQQLMQKTNGRIRLRLVGDEKAEFSYKKPLPTKPDEPKKEIEYQVEFSKRHVVDLINIIKCMGYSETTSYERYRTEYSKESTKVTIDIFPFAIILEIEGDEVMIKRLRRKLGLELSDHINDACDTLFTKWRVNHGLEPKDHMRFKDYDR